MDNTHGDRTTAALNLYSSKTGEGGVWIDLEGFAVDFIMAVKVSGCSLETAVENISRLWPEVKVELKIPKKDLQ